MEPLTIQTPLSESKRELPVAEQGFAFHYAAEYYDRGWSVIPLTGKRPSLISWRQYQSERASLDQLRRWFCKGRANVGIATGLVSGLVVVDCDTPVDTNYWRQHYPPSPLVVSTGGGGAHIYYRHPAGETIGNRVRLLSRQIDLRGEGGYVVAPPSQHPSGGFYQWESAGHYRLDDVPYFSADWIRAESDSVLPSRASRSAVLQPRTYIRSIQAISGQGGHNQTFRAACVLRDAGLSPEEALCEMVLWNETNAVPPWSTRELLHKVQSAFQAPATNHGKESTHE